MPAFFRPIALVACALISLLPGRAQQVAPAPAGAAPATGKVANSTLTSPVEAAQQKIADAVKKMNGKDPEGALTSLTQAIALNPNAAGAYVLRASIYCQKRQWTLAEDDFKSAAKIAPKNSVLQFNLVEVKFMQKEYDAARPGFVALQNDADMGDFAQYKVFLCDLYGGHEDAAKKELDVFNDAMGNPSYYFSNAAWDLYYKKIDDARNWLLSASRIYPPQKFTLYGEPLRYLGYLPIPEPKKP